MLVYQRVMHKLYASCSIDKNPSSRSRWGVWYPQKVHRRIGKKKAKSLALSETWVPPKSMKNPMVVILVSPHVSFQNPRRGGQRADGCSSTLSTLAGGGAVHAGNAGHVINQPWLGMVHIPPIKMVMTGGWSIVLPLFPQNGWMLMENFMKIGWSGGTYTAWNRTDLRTFTPEKPVQIKTRYRM